MLSDTDVMSTTLVDSTFPPQNIRPATLTQHHKHLDARAYPGLGFQTEHFWASPFH